MSSLSCYTKQGKPRKQRRCWTTKDGTKIPVYKMSDQHLLNAIKLLRRHHEAVLWNMSRFADFLQGEMAIEAAESELSLAEEEESLHPLFDYLCLDAERRGLNIDGGKQ